jgi:hypothetical protein
MPWTVDVRIDSDQPDVGFATMSWSAPGKPEEVFSFSSRVKINDVEGPKIVAAAIAARDAWQAGTAKNQAKSGWLLSALTTADKKG